MRRPLTISLLIMAVIVVAFIYTARRHGIRADTKPELGSANPTSVDFDIRGERVATITNAAAFLLLLRQGRAVQAHDCTIPGRLFFHYADGRVDEIDVLPGHTTTTYEFTCSNGYFAVPRAAFMAVLASAGVDTNKIPTE